MTARQDRARKLSCFISSPLGVPLALPLVALLALTGCSNDSSSSSDKAASARPAETDNGSQNPTDDSKKNDASGAQRAIAEADIVQLVDGRLYAMSKAGTLSIIDASRPSRLALLGQAYLPGEPFEMYLRGDLLVVMTNGAYAMSGSVNERRPANANVGQPESSGIVPVDPTSGAGVIVINVKDPGLMQRVATFPVPGEIADSRIVGDILYLATYETGACYQCAGQTRTLVTSFDLGTPASMRQVDQAVFVSSQGMSWEPTAWKRSIVVTPERMYVGGHDDRSPATNQDGGEGVIDVLDITDPTGKLGKGAHLTTTGSILSRWQMNESNGVLRVVSQRGNGWATNGIGDPEVETFHIWNTGAMQPMGKTSIAMPRQEALKAVRFDGNRAYAITFAETDPLFIIDLADPAKPKQRGKLVMPGWVFHLEPHGDRLLGLGIDRTSPLGHLNVSLFDVSDMDHPTMLQRVAFGPRKGGSEQQILSYELPEDQDRIQKAFRVLANGLIVVPYAGTSARTTNRTTTCASQGSVQLIDWQQDVLTKQAALPVAGNPRRALLNQGELLAVSDSNVTAFDLSRRGTAVVPAQTADLVIGACELRPMETDPQLGLMPGRDVAMGDDDDDGYGFYCTSSSSVPSRSACWSGILLVFVAVAGALRRRASRA